SVRSGAWRAPPRARLGGRDCFKAVKGRIDAFGKGSVDALHAGDCRRAGGLEPAQPAEVPEQVGATPRSDARDVFEPAGVADLGTAATVAGDGKAVRLVADLLHQLQGG